MNRAIVASLTRLALPPSMSPCCKLTQRRPVSTLMRFNGRVGRDEHARHCQLETLHRIPVAAPPGHLYILNRPVHYPMQDGKKIWGQNMRSIHAGAGSTGRKTLPVATHTLLLSGNACRLERN